MKFIEVGVIVYNGQKGGKGCKILFNNVTAKGNFFFFYVYN